MLYRTSHNSYAVLDMKKRIKNVKRKKSSPKHDNYLLRIGKGERLYKFYYFRPIAGRHYHFEYRILTKEKTDGMLEMVSYNFKIVNGEPQKSSVTRIPKELRITASLLIANSHCFDSVYSGKEVL